MGFAPERLKEIRLLNGYTLDKVAEKICVSKQAVSKYEAGKAIPATDTLARILNLYGIRQDYLTNQRGLPDDRSVVFYRTVKRTPMKAKEVAEVYLKWFYEMITVIEGIYPLRKPDLPRVPVNLSIQEKAEFLRENWGLGEGVVDNMVSLLEKHGFCLFTVAWEEKKIDGFSQMIGSRPIIIINGKRGTKQRRQFSIAHELGHLVLHRDVKELTDEMEKEADEFAGCFLMPERMIRADLIRRDADYFVELSKKWQVSPQALLERSKNLKLLGRNEEENEARRHSLYQKLNRKATGEDSDIICSIRAALALIETDAEKAEQFLRDLRLPVKELQQLCGMTANLARYEQIDHMEDINDVEGTQMSFAFEK